MTTPESRKGLDNAVIETLDLSDATTMYNWSLLRAFFLDFGLRFLKREEAVLGFFVLSMLIIMGYYISLVYLDPEFVDPFDAAFICCSSCAVLYPALSALRWATRINTKMQQQKTILADKRLRLENEKGKVDAEYVRKTRERLRTLSVEESEEQMQRKIADKEDGLRKGSEMLEAIVALLDADKFRIRLLGYQIDETVTGIIGAVVAAVGYTVARLLLGPKAEGLDR